jgi:hypothetical protein
MNPSDLPALLKLGGSFDGGPATAQNEAGDTCVAARDLAGSMWIRCFWEETKSLTRWINLRGVLTGEPAIATSGNTLSVAARDDSGGYWLTEYTFGIATHSWESLGGTFDSDPAIAQRSRAGGSLYVVGRDKTNGIWIRTVPGQWRYLGATAAGRPAVVVGSDDAAYVVIRDAAGAVWMGRYSGDSFGGWQPAGGSIATDPQAAATSAMVYVAGVTSAGNAWYNSFTIGAVNRWTGWRLAGGGVLESLGIAVSGESFFLVGQQQRDGELWWFQPPDRWWSPGGKLDLVLGSLVAGPR